MGFDNVNVNVSGPVQPTSTYKTKILKGNHSFASQVTEPNMKYVIKHDFDLGGESVTIPANCVLEFDGGSLSNGTITLDNTFIKGTKGFKSDIALTGTVSNPVVSSSWFEMPSADCAGQFKNMVALSSSSNKPIDIVNGEYNIHYAGYTLTVTQSINFNNSIINFYSGNNEDAIFFFFSNTQNIYIPEEDYAGIRELINNRQNTNDTIKKYKNCLMTVHTDVIEFQRHYTGADPFKQEETFYIDCNGYVESESFFNNAGELDEIVSGGYRVCDKRMTIENAVFNIIDEFIGSQTVEYRRLFHRTQFCSHIYFKNLTYYKNITSTNYTFTNPAGHCYDIQYINIDMESWHDTGADPVGDGKSHSDYNISMSHNYNILWDNVRIGALESEKWGDTGCNHLTNWTIRNSKLSRIDTHYRLHNLYVENSDIGYLAFTGWGEAVLQGCRFYGNKIYYPRSDYGAFFDGDISIKDCVFYLNGISCIIYTKVHDHDYMTTSDRFKYFLARRISISNFRVVGTSGLYLDVIETSGLPAGALVNVHTKRVYSQINISNMYINKHLYLPVNSYYDDFFENERNIYISDCGKTLNNIYNAAGFANNTYLQSKNRDENYYNNNSKLRTNIYMTNCKTVDLQCLYKNIFLFVSNSEIVFIRKSSILNALVTNCHIEPGINYDLTLNNKTVKYSGCVFGMGTKTDEEIKSFYSIRRDRGTYVYNTTNGTKYENCSYSEKLAEFLGIDIYTPFVLSLNTYDEDYEQVLNTKKHVWWHITGSTTQGEWRDALGNVVTCYGVTPTLTDLIIANPPMIENGTVFSTTLVPRTGYALPSTITIKMGSTTLTPGTDYTYDSSTGAINILGSGGTGGVTGAINITANGTVMHG